MARDARPAGMHPRLIAAELLTKTFGLIAVADGLLVRAYFRGGGGPLFLLYFSTAAFGFEMVRLVGVGAASFLPWRVAAASTLVGFECLGAPSVDTELVVVGLLVAVLLAVADKVGLGTGGGLRTLIITLGRVCVAGIVPACVEE